MKSCVIGIALSLLVAASGAAQTPVRERGWVDVNVGAANAADATRSTLATWTQSNERASFGVDYKQPTGADFDFGGGFMFTPVLGIGLSFSGTAHQSPADVSLTLPHPLAYNHTATVTGQTDAKLNYTEGAAHVQVMVNVPTANRKVRIRVFGGPTHFSAKGDALTDVRWYQSYGGYYSGYTNSITITGTSTKEVTATAWGFHVGGDVSYFFSRVVGIGGLVRFSNGKATIKDVDVFADEPLDVKLGGLQAGFGLRLRFGGR